MEGLFSWTYFIFSIRSFSYSSSFNSFTSLVGDDASTFELATGLGSLLRRFETLDMVLECFAYKIWTGRQMKLNRNQAKDDPKDASIVTIGCDVRTGTRDC